MMVLIIKIPLFHVGKSVKRDCRIILEIKEFFTKKNNGLII